MQNHRPRVGEGDHRHKGLIHRLALRFAERWIAGERREDALVRAAELRAAGMRSIINYLGEDLVDERAVQETVAEYERLLEELSPSGLGASISIKLTQLGLLIAADECYSNVKRLVSRASDHGIFVWFDMEQHQIKDATIDIYRAIHRQFPKTGICLQAYLKSTESDARKLLAEEAVIRLCKGAYRPPRDVRVGGAFEIRENFLKLVNLLARESRVRFAVASHDDRIVDEVRRLECPVCPPEFQFLLGVRDRLKAELVDEGCDVVVYVPYGARWAKYAYRRFRERPASAILLARSLLRD